MAFVGARRVLALGQGVPYLLYDAFLGSVAALSGRVPTRGSAWQASGTGAANVVAGGGDMYQNGAGSESYAIAALARQPRMFGCRFVCSDVYTGLTLGGSYSNGSRVVIQIQPSRSASIATIDVTTQAGDVTLAGAATRIAAAISADATLSAAGVAAVAVGADIQVRATECPRITATAVLAGTITLAAKTSGTPTLACYVTGANFISGMVHCRLGPDGYLDWSIYANGPSFFTPSSITVVGLATNVEYTYVVSIDGTTATGAVSSTSGAASQIAVTDARITTYAGASVFFENYADGALRYRRAWAV